MQSIQRDFGPLSVFIYYIICVPWSTFGPASTTHNPKRAAKLIIQVSPGGGGATSSTTFTSSASANELLRWGNGWVLYICTYIKSPHTLLRCLPVYPHTGCAVNYWTFPGNCLHAESQRITLKAQINSAACDDDYYDLHQIFQLLGLYDFRALDCIVKHDHNSGTIRRE